jgi:hypothetical protein
MPKKERVGLDALAMAADRTPPVHHFLSLHIIQPFLPSCLFISDDPHMSGTVVHNVHGVVFFFYLEISMRTRERGERSAVVEKLNTKMRTIYTGFSVRRNV